MENSHVFYSYQGKAVFHVLCCIILLFLTTLQKWFYLTHLKIILLGKGRPWPPHRGARLSEGLESLL